MTSYEFWEELNKIFNAVVSYQEKSVEFNSRFITPWIRLGNIFDRQDQWQERVDSYKKAIEMDPSNVELWLELGNLYQEKSEYEDALNAFKHAIELNPDMGWAYSSLGAVHMARGDHDMAVECFETSINLLVDKNDKAVVWNQLGNLHRKKQQYDLALEAFRCADELNVQDITKVDEAGAQAAFQLVETSPAQAYQNKQPEASGTDQASREVNPSLSAEESQPYHEEQHETSSVVDREDDKFDLTVEAQNAQPNPDDVLEMPVISQEENESGVLTDGQKIHETESPLAGEHQPEKSPPEAGRPETPIEEDEDSIELTLHYPQINATNNIETLLVAEVTMSNDMVSLSGISDSLPSEPQIESSLISKDPTEECDIEPDILMSESLDLSNHSHIVEETQSTDVQLEDDFAEENPEEHQTMINAPSSVTEELASPAPVNSDVVIVTERDEEVVDLPKDEESEADTEEVLEEVEQSDVAESAAETASLVEDLPAPEPSENIEVIQTDTIEKESDPDVSTDSTQPEYEEFLRDEGRPYAFIMPSEEMTDATNPQDNPPADPVTIVDPFGEVQMEVDINNAKVWNELGNVYYNNGALEDAIVAYAKSIELDRSFAWPYSNLALVYVQKDRLAEAVLLYQRSIELFNQEKDKAIAWNCLGNVYRRMDDYTNAISAYQRADELDPNNISSSLQSRYSLLGTLTQSQDMVIS